MLVLLEPVLSFDLSALKTAGVFCLSMRHHRMIFA